ncbi:hypothetical protein ACQ4PT_033959 [Festuca glaucescens]
MGPARRSRARRRWGCWATPSTGPGQSLLRWDPLVAHGRDSAARLGGALQRIAAPAWGEGEPRRGVRHRGSAGEEESPKVLELGDAIAGLTLEEARNLVDLLQERLGVSAASFAPAAVVAAVAEQASTEKTEFAVVVPSSARCCGVEKIV